jgi:hypothetical protein
MDPQTPTSPNGGQNPYDFIINGHQKKKRSFLPSNNSPKDKMLFMVAGIGIVLAVLALVIMVFFSGGGASAGLTTVAQKQTEVIRISNVGSQKARSTKTVALAENTLVTTTTAQQETIAYIKKKGKAPTTKTLALGANKQSDIKLATAERAGQYDEVFTSIIKADLNSYQQELASAYKASNSKTEKALLQKQYNQVVVLLKSAQ